MRAANAWLWVSTPYLMLWTMRHRTARRGKLIDMGTIMHLTPDAGRRTPPTRIIKVYSSTSVAVLALERSLAGLGSVELGLGEDDCGVEGDCDKIAPHRPRAASAVKSRRSTLPALFRGVDSFSRMMRHGDSILFLFVPVARPLLEAAWDNCLP